MSVLPSNAHTHSTYSDGMHTPRQIAQQALALGMTGLGFTDHSPASFDPACPGVLDEAAYKAEIAALKEEYAGRLDILCGIEQDYFGPVDRSGYDYILGSVHYLEPELVGGQYNAADDLAATLVEVNQRYFGGNGLAMAQSFYELSVRNVREYKPDIVGHFDLIVKLNGEAKMFDENSKAYQDLALGAIDEVCNIIIPYGGIVEINAGAIARGYREAPYPAAFILKHLAQRGTRVMVNSDSHDKATLNHSFEKCVVLAGQAGFSRLAVLQNGGFQDIPLPL